MPDRREASLPMMARAAEVRPESVDAASRTIEVVWTTGATVKRRRWEEWEAVEYDEELIVSENAVRLERMNAGAPFLDSHSSWSLSSVLGSVVPGSVRIEGGQGTATVQLTAAEDAKDAVTRILEKSVRFVSVGYVVHRFDITKKDGERELWRATDWEPYEISAVAMPADAGAHVRSANKAAEAARHPCVLIRQDDTAAAAADKRGKSMSKDTQPGGDQTTRTNEALETPAPVQTTPAAGAAGADSQRAADAARAEERARVRDITALCERHGIAPAVRAQMIDSGVAIEAARVTILDEIAKRNPTAGAGETVPAQARGNGDAGLQRAMTEAILHRANPGVHAVTEAARPFIGRTLMELARVALERGGMTTDGMGKMELAREALNQRAGVGYHATGDFPNVLAAVINKTLRAAYDSTPRTFTGWARRATIPDFKSVTRVQLGGAPDLLKVPEGAEFKYGTMGDAKEVYALSTYGRIIAFTRQMLINDDLSAFDRIPAAFGASAADLESDIVYGILKDNAALADGTALFHANHGNLAGTGTDVTEAGLTAMYRAFAKQTGLEGRLIAVQPRFLIVPPGQRSVAARKQVTAVTPATADGVNPYAGRLEVVEEPRLIPASGNDPWYAAADPSRVDTIEYGYLEGQTGIYTETRMGFEVDGVEVKARHDFAAKAIDHRGLYKNAGA
jgi:hypothetical protein